MNGNCHLHPRACATLINKIQAPFIWGYQRQEQETVKEPSLVRQSRTRLRRAHFHIFTQAFGAAVTTQKGTPIPSSSVPVCKHIAWIRSKSPGSHIELRAPKRGSSYPEGPEFAPQAYSFPVSCGIPLKRCAPTAYFLAHNMCHAKKCAPAALQASQTAPKSFAGPREPSEAYSSNQVPAKGSL